MQVENLKRHNKQQGLSQRANDHIQYLQNGSSHAGCTLSDVDWTKRAVIVLERSEWSSRSPYERITAPRVHVIKSYKLKSDRVLVIEALKRVAGAALTSHG